MQAPLKPTNEFERIAALRELLVLDTAPDERFDAITHYAASQFNVPIALVSLVDTDRQWFKSRCGLDATETSREISFCGHAILAPEIFEIPDAAADPRFADNPLVTGPPYIRFYAGAPLGLPGALRVGTLCLISPHPKRLDAWEREHLKALAALVAEELQGQTPSTPLTELQAKGSAKLP